MQKTRRWLLSAVRRLFDTRYRARHNATQYLTSLELTDDPLALIRARAESAQDVMRDVVVVETIQRMNESIVSEIVSGDMSDEKVRQMLFLKLQLVTDFQTTLMTYINEYETMATIREAERRAESDSDAPWPNREVR